MFPIGSILLVRLAISYIPYSEGNIAFHNIESVLRALAANNVHYTSNPWLIVAVFEYRGYDLLLNLTRKSQAASEKMQKLISCVDYSA